MEDGEAGSVSRMRRAVGVASGIVGGVLGGLLRVPLSVVLPEWAFSTLPLVLGALFAAGLACSASGLCGGRFSRVLLAASSVAALCALINLSLLLATVAGVLHPVWLLGPPGFLTGFVEAMILGTAAGVSATRGGSASGRRGLRAWPVLLGGAVLLVLGSIMLPAAFACSAEERDVFGEFPQFGGLRVEPTGNPEVGSCAAYYATRSPAEEVFAYFKERFEENGWDGRPSESYRIVAEGGEEVCVPTDLIAERDGFRYRVSAEEIDPEAGGHAPGTGVAAHVSRVPEGERYIPPGGPPPGCRLGQPGDVPR